MPFILIIDYALHFKLTMSLFNVLLFDKIIFVIKYKKGQKNTILGWQDVCSSTGH